MRRSLLLRLPLRPLALPLLRRCWVCCQPAMLLSTDISTAAAAHNPALPHPILIPQVWASKWNDRAWLSRRTQGVPDAGARTSSRVGAGPQRCIDSPPSASGARFRSPRRPTILTASSHHPPPPPPPADLYMAVLLQAVAPAQYAFVLHTADPLTGAQLAGYLAGGRAGWLAVQNLWKPAAAAAAALPPVACLPLAATPLAPTRVPAQRPPRSLPHASLRPPHPRWRRRARRAARRAGGGHGRGPCGQLPRPRAVVCGHRRRRAAPAVTARQAGGPVCGRRGRAPHRALRLQR